MIMARATITRIRRRSLFERLFSLPWKPMVTTEETRAEIEVYAPLSPAAMAAARGMQNANPHAPCAHPQNNANTMASPQQPASNEVLVRLTEAQAKTLSGKLWSLQDEGPINSGWASDELQELRDIIDASIGPTILNGPD